MCALPAATFDPTKQVAGRQSILTITIAATPTSLLVEYVGHIHGLELARAQAPGASNTAAYTSKVWERSRSEMLKFRTKELKKVNTLLGSLSSKKDGTCTAYIRDPDDAANVVALKTDDFACSVYRDTDEAALQGTAVTEVTLVVESRKDGPITFTNDASTA